MTTSNFVISVRNVRRGQLGDEPGPTRYLEVPAGAQPDPIAHKVPQARWLKSVLARAEVGRHPPDPKNPVGGYAFGSLLVFVHGYNSSVAQVMRRHDRLQQQLTAQGYQGAIVSFDWPSAASALNYLEDRSDAKATASSLVRDGIALLARNQLAQDRNHCDIDVHLLGHSTGAYVIREAFYEASHNRSLARVNWEVSQVALIGGDIARKSTSRADGKSQGLFRHAKRITNYQNPFDAVLKMSSIKRLGTEPRIGRVGIAADAPDTLVNVNVGDHWRQLAPTERDPLGAWSHSWHFDDPTFAKDLFLTLQGDIDRHAIPTRRELRGDLLLVGG